MVRDLPRMGNVPCAMWLGGAFTMLAGQMDPMTDAVVLNTILDKTEASYNVDKSRVYCTGHSNGSMMTFTLAANGASRFAAVAPIGAFSTLEITDKALLPVWTMCGEFDSAATPAMVEANATVTMLQSWNAHNGVNEAAPVMSEQHDGQWKTMTFENADGVPMVKFTNVLRTAHIYMPEQPQAVWYDFFTKFTRGEDGTLFYEGNAVNAGEYAADANWYEPAPVEEKSTKKATSKKTGSTTRKTTKKKETGA
jgi:polyhydroxybutyrate depolymerase